MGPVLFLCVCVCYMYMFTRDSFAVDLSHSLATLKLWNENLSPNFTSLIFCSTIYVFWKVPSWIYIHFFVKSGVPRWNSSRDSLKLQSLFASPPDAPWGNTGTTTGSAAASWCPCRWTPRSSWPVWWAASALFVPSLAFWFSSTRSAETPERPSPWCKYDRGHFFFFFGCVFLVLSCFFFSS